MSVAFQRALRIPDDDKIAAGKINAISSTDWNDGLHRDPQDYVVSLGQHWFDGFDVGEDVIRQFVAMPTGAAEHGGLQIQAFPMKREAYQKRFPDGDFSGRVNFKYEACFCMNASMDMGLAPGGRMNQEIFEDPYRLEERDLENSSRCFVHIANSLVWEAVTGSQPPTPPPTAEAYTEAGLPWFDYYDDALALKGSDQLAKLKSVLEMGRQKGEVPLPENSSVTGERVVQLRKKGVVREGAF